MALAGWVYQWRENARKFSLSSGGNVAEKTLEVKALKFLAVAGRGCDASRINHNQQPKDEFKNRSKRRSRRGNEAEVFIVQKSASSRRRLLFFDTPQSTIHTMPFTNQRASLIVRTGPIL